MKRTSKVLGLIFVFLLLIILSSCKNNYEVIFKDYDGTILKTETVNKGSDVTPPTSPENKEGYHFVGWDKELTNVSGSLEITALYEINKYEVKFIDYDKTILDTQIVNHGSSAIAPEDPNNKEGYHFLKWDQDFTNVKGNLTIIALYEINEYTIEFQFEEKTYEMQKVKHGELPIAPNVDDGSDYEFIGWEPEIKEATNDQIYKAKLISFYSMAKDDDFEGEKDGEFVYIGDKDYIIIPEYIKGVKVTKTSNLGTDGITDVNDEDFVSLFMKRNEIKGVKFENPNNIISTSAMFAYNKSENIILRHLKLNNVTDLSYMFYQAKAENLDLTSFNTENVTNMSYMFFQSHTIILDLRSFDTTNVINMEYIFADSFIDYGFVNNQNEADKLNEHKNVFVLKDNKEDQVNYIYLGKYPQTVVDDQSLIDILDSLTETNSNGYYEYHGFEYAKQPAYTAYTDYHFNNGQTADYGENYYFKVEPIKWLILEQEDGTIFLLTDKIIDTVKFEGSVAQKNIDGKKINASNYEHSQIRNWLNDSFYNLAFTEIQKNRIKNSFIDNSKITTTNRYNPYTGNNTNDEVFLLSYKDVTTYLVNDNERLAYVTDYAIARGVNYTFDYFGNWWLRSPTDYYAYYANFVNLEGAVYGANVDSRFIGVRPAIKIYID